MEDDIKIKIRPAQNVGKVWISRKKNLPAPFGAIPGNFFAWAGKMQKMQNFCLFSLVGQWALFTRFGVMCWCHSDTRSSNTNIARSPGLGHRKCPAGKRIYDYLGPTKTYPQNDYLS